MKNRWAALAIVFISFLQFTINWFCIVPAFGGIVTDMEISFAQVGIIVGAFIAGYGLAHIPGGWLAERFGMRAAMLSGITIQTAGAAVSATAPSFEILLAGRFLCGIGGSIYIGSAIGLTAAWFRGKELATANGIIQGGAFTLGAAIGIYAWRPVIVAFGWQDALMIGALIGVATWVFVLLFFPTPPGSSDDVLEGHHLGKDSLKRVFGNPALWIMGIALLGAYGSYFSAAQLLPHYAQTTFDVDASAGDAISVILMLSGIAGGIIGGVCADRFFGVLPTFIGACTLQGLMFLMVPYVDLFGVQVAAGVIGASLIAAFVPWVSIPGQRDSGFLISDVPTAIGLMLTIVAVGGATVAPVFTRIAATWSFDVAWIFQGVITIGFAFLALLAKSRRAPAVEVGRGAEFS